MRKLERIWDKRINEIRNSKLVKERIKSDFYTKILNINYFRKIEVINEFQKNSMFIFKMLFKKRREEMKSKISQKSLSNSPVSLSKAHLADLLVPSNYEKDFKSVQLNKDFSLIAIRNVLTPTSKDLNKLIFKAAQIDANRKSDFELFNKIYEKEKGNS